MKTRDLAPRQVLAIPCPTCGSRPGKPCELSAGGLRSTPHHSRELVAADDFLKKIETGAFNGTLTAELRKLTKEQLEEVAQVLIERDARRARQATGAFGT